MMKITVIIYQIKLSVQVTEGPYDVFYCTALMITSRLTMTPYQ